jgi:hypothetical protein
MLGVYGLSVPHNAVIRQPPSQYPLDRSLLVSATIVARLEKILPQCRCLSTNNPLKPCKSTYFVFCDTVLRTTTGFFTLIFAMSLPWPSLTRSRKPRLTPMNSLRPSLVDAQLSI